MDSGRLVNFGLSAGVICQWIEKKIRRHAFLEPCDGTRCTPRGKRQVLINVSYHSLEMLGLEPFKP